VTPSASAKDAAALKRAVSSGCRSRTCPDAVALSVNGPAPRELIDTGHEFFVVVRVIRFWLSTQRVSEILCEFDSLSCVMTAPVGFTSRAMTPTPIKEGKSTLRRKAIEPLLIRDRSPVLPLLIYLKLLHF
jgi:hypothetical protein